MSVAFAFPGQGSQKVGMGKDLADSFIEARRVFEEVDSTLSQNLSHIIWNGPELELTRTENAQPALMAVSIAVLRVLESHGFCLKEKVSCLAGHSLGEYSALIAAGVFSLADGARLLRIRGQAMQSCVALDIGAMAAIIGFPDDLEEVCQKFGSRCQIANDNGAGQFVISGFREDVLEAMRICVQRGAKRAILLPVSAPFHCPLMEPAAEIMKEALAHIKKAPPCLPVISNVSVTPLFDSDDIAAHLVKQVTARVRWRETMEWFIKNAAVNIFCEIGAGNVLSGLARRAHPSLKTFSIGTSDHVKQALQTLMPF